MPEAAGSPPHPKSGRAQAILAFPRTSKLMRITAQTKPSAEDAESSPRACPAIPTAQQELPLGAGTGVPGVGAGTAVTAWL